VRIVARMERVIALRRACSPDWPLEMARSAIVLFCATALIAAGHILPL